MRGGRGIADWEGGPIQVLWIGAEPAGGLAVAEMLGRAQRPAFEVVAAASLEHAGQTAPDRPSDAILLELPQADTDPLEALARAKRAAPGVPIVVMAAAQDEALGLEAVRFGAHDHLVREACNASLLARTLRHVVERHRILLDLQSSRQREHFLATHDGLTGLVNRFHFQDLLDRGLARATRQRKPLALLLVDLDRFKRINDTLGHPAGDQLLKVEAERLSASLRRSDVVARLGADEFAVLAPDVHREYDPAKVARNLLHALAEPVVLGGRECRVTATLGIAVFPRDARDGDALMRNAEAALCEAKTANPGGFRYYADDMNTVAVGRLGMEDHLHQALERNELVVHYQPQIDVSRGQIVGAEALVRWLCPERGMVPPGEFIPVAEETGIITAIGEWVLRTASERVVDLNRDLETPIRIGVNVSTRQLSQKGFAELVSGVVREVGLEPELLDLEITESSVLEPGGLTMANLILLRRLGVHVSIDDFGTGYSSLTALMNLPVSGFKIDRSFVRDIISNEATATISKALIAIGKGLGLGTIAEGVETREQLEYLHHHGCDHMQGYLFGKPVDAEEFAAQLSSSTPPWDLDALD